MKIPIDVHLYDLWSNGGVDPWDSSSFASISGSILCFGPRGCGKTFLANRLVSLSGRPGAELTAPDILKNPETLDDRLDNVLSNQNCILILENVGSALTGLRNHPWAHQLLIDRLRHPPSRTVIFGTGANPFDLLEEELGAFEWVLPVFYQDALQREVQMMNLAEQLTLMPHVDLAQVAAETEWWSGEELADLMKAVSDKAVIDEAAAVTQADFSREMKVIETNIRPEKKEKDMSKFLRFAAEHGTSEYISKEIEGRFGPDYGIPSGKVPSIGLIGPTIPTTETTLFDRWQKWFKNQRPVAILLIIVAVLTAIGSVVTALTSINDFVKLLRIIVR